MTSQKMIVSLVVKFMHAKDRKRNVCQILHFVDSLIWSPVRVHLYISQPSECHSVVLDE